MPMNKDPEEVWQEAYNDATEEGFLDEEASDKADIAFVNYLAINPEALIKLMKEKEDG